VSRFGHVNEHGATEVIALHGVASARIPRPDIAQLARKIEARPESTARRSTFFASLIGPWTRRSILAGIYRLVGRATALPVIEEYGSTTIVGPYDDFEIGQLGEITIHIDRRAREAGRRNMIRSHPTTIDPVVLESSPMNCSRSPIRWKPI